MNTKFKTDHFEANTGDVLRELATLLDFSTPRKIREHLLETFFAYLIEMDGFYPNHHKALVEDHYFLLGFFGRLEELNNKTENTEHKTGKKE
jgi:hypothetical protein